MMESMKFFEDHEIIYKTLMDRLDQLFQKTYDTCRRGSNLKEEMLHSEESINFFENSRESRQIMRALTQFKVYEPIESDEFHGGKRFQLINQSKVISTLWSTLRDKVEQLSNEYVKDVLNLVGDLGSTTNMQSLFVFWDKILVTFNDAIMIVSPLLEYLTENYPLITKEIPRGYAVSDYANKLLVEALKRQLGFRFVTFLESFLNYFRFQKEPDLSILEYESPLALMYKFNIGVDPDSLQSVKDFYFEYLSNYVQNELDIPLDIHYLKTLIKHLRYNSLLTGSISATMVEKANDIFLRHTILESDTAARIIEIFKTDMPLKFNSRPHPFCTLVENFHWIVVAYESRAKTIQLEEIFRRIVQKDLKIAYQDPEKLFTEVCKFILLADKKTKFRAISQAEVTKILGGAFNIMEFYMRLCESNIRLANRKFRENIVDYYSNSAAIFYAPMLLHINSTVLSLYSRSLFRRAIVQGASPVIKSLWDTRCLENNMLTFFKCQYGTTSEYHNLEAIQEIIYKASNLQANFEQNGPEASKFMNPLVFEKKMVPIIYQESSNEDVVLPKELVNSWKEFIEYFKTTDKKAGMKKLHPVYHLQHCEVATPYKLKNGKKLSFELTLYQTCLLSLFNDFGALDYQEFMTKLQMKEGTLDVVLKSFTDIGLLVSKNEKYILNKDFTPDKRRIKDGKLRVALSRPTVSHPKKLYEPLITSSQHHEGHSSQWKQELLKACIVRSLKGERDGLNLAALFNKVEAQIQGISIGEFKDALQKNLKDKFITSKNDLYIY